MVNIVLNNHYQWNVAVHIIYIFHGTSRIQFGVAFSLLSISGFYKQWLYLISPICKIWSYCRHSKSPSAPSQSAGTGFTEDAASSSGSNNALVLFDATAPATATTNSNAKEQDLIDLLSIVLTTNPTPSETLPAPESAPAQNAYEVPYTIFH